MFEHFISWQKCGGNVCQRFWQYQNGENQLKFATVQFPQEKTNVIDTCHTNDLIDQLFHFFCFFFSFVLAPVFISRHDYLLQYLLQKYSTKCIESQLFTSLMKSRKKTRSFLLIGHASFQYIQNYELAIVFFLVSFFLLV